MSAAVPRGLPARPPEVDDGGPVSLGPVLLETLAFSRDRLRSTVLVLVPMLLVLAIFETFRLPNPGIAVFLTLLMARGDAISTMSSSTAIAIAFGLSALIATVVLSASLSQPALRIPLMTLMTFTTMFLMRATTLGPLAFITGFFAFYGTTQADSLLGISMSTAEVTNTEGAGRPQIDFMPPEEALLHSVLWLSMAAAIPAILTWITHRLFGTDPRRLLLDRLDVRWTVVAGFCRGKPGAGKTLREAAREGVRPLLDLVGLSERAHGSGALHDAHEQLARGLYRLLLLLVAWDLARACPGPAATTSTEAETGGDAPFLREIGKFADAFNGRTRHGRWVEGTEPAVPPAETEHGLRGALVPLAAEIRSVLDRLRDAESDRSVALWRPDADPVRSLRRRLWQPDPFSAANIRFSLKATLTVMTAYLLVNGLDWGGISAAYVTCFFVALGTIGETVHKMTLRLTGCLIGAVLGIGSILLLMPSMTGLGQLCVLFGAVAFASTWIGFGSARVSYAGWQMLLAFALTTLQGWGPTLDMQTARDRVLGILLGNLVTTLVFRFIWPVPVGGAIRADMARAFETLGLMMALPGIDETIEARRGRVAELNDGFIAALAHAGGLIPDDRFEFRVRGTEAGRVGRTELTRLARLVAPVSVIATDGAAAEIREHLSPRLRDDVVAYHRAMTAWFNSAAAWLRTGEHRSRLRDTLPSRPALDDAAGAMPPVPARRIEGRAALYALTDRMITDFLDNALPEPARREAADGTNRSLSLAAG